MKRSFPAEAAARHTASAPPPPEFIMTQYRDGKTVLAPGAATALLAKAGLAAKAKRGQVDAGILMLDAGDHAAAASAFVAASTEHRHRERERASS
jgi:catalase